MAHYDQIGETGLDQVLARRLVTPGGAVAPMVAPELFPGLTLESDRPEWGFLKGELPYGRTQNLGAAGANNHVIVRNPAGSRTLVVIKSVVAAVSAGTVLIFLAPAGNIAAGVAQGAGIPRDGRQSQIVGGVFTRQGTATIHTLDAAAPAFQSVFRGVGTSFDSDLPYMVTPGTDFAIVANTAAATLTVALAYTERVLQPSEL